jgi:hypothetical protein
MSDTPSCKSRWAAEKNSEIRTIRKLWKLYCAGNEDGDEDGCRFEEHGLAFDYVAPGTFKNTRGYWRWQISWGGPSDEFRFYAREKLDMKTDRVYRDLLRVEYAFLDWFDGYSRKLTGEDEKLLREIWESYFEDCGAVSAAYDKACNE